MTISVICSGLALCSAMAAANSPRASEPRSLAIINGRITDSKSQANRLTGRSLPEVPPERPRGERSLTKLTYPLKTSGIHRLQTVSVTLRSAESLIGDARFSESRNPCGHREEEHVRE